MKAGSIWGRLMQGLAGQASSGSQGILSEAEYTRMLDYERALADRHERSFALLVLSPVTDRDPARFNAALIGVLKRRLRTTDVMGWTRSGCVGVILPHSDHAGAQVVADAICNNMLSRSHRAQCDLHVYPGETSTVDLADGVAAASRAAVPSGNRPRMMALLAHPLPRYKRGLDIVIALLALIVTAPLIALAALFIKRVSPGPALFRQERVGHLGTHFPCWKLRTMTMAADPGVHALHVQDLMRTDAPMTKLDLRHDARLIPFGNFLRASGVDELPQLINVLRGEMSFVGPRPCVPYEYNQYQGWHKRRFDARPGLTGLWQVSGKNRTTFGEMMRLDVAYSRHQSLPGDLRIVWRTLPVLVEQVQRVLPRRALKQEPLVALV